MEKNKPHGKADHQEKKTDYLDQLVFGIALLITFTAIIAGYVPLLMTIFLILFVITTYLYGILRTNRLPSLSMALKQLYTPSSTLGTVLLIFSAYIAVSSLWSADMATSISKALLIAFLVTAHCLGHNLSSNISELQLYRITRGILIGTVIALMYPLIELSTDHAILNYLADWFPRLIKTLKNTHQVPGYYLNKNVTILVLFFWPALLVAYLWSEQNNSRPEGLFFSILLAGTLLPVVFLSQSETAKAAIIFGGLGFSGAYFFPRLLHFMAQTAWTTAVIGAIPLVMILHGTGLQNSTWLPYSARDRIYIWNYTAKLVEENPLLGIGVRSGRFYEKLPTTSLPDNPPKLKDHPGWHSHNIFLQIWYELGAVGAAFLLIIGLLVLRAIKTIETGLRPFAYGAYASIGAVAAFGYGIWQSWLLASLSWTVLFLLFAFKYAKSLRAPLNKLND